MDFGHSGSLELAMERWLGHCELLAAISSNWLAKGDFLPVSVIERFKVIETAVSSAAASSEAAAGPARGKALSHEDRLAEIGKINDRSKVRFILLYRTHESIASFGTLEIRLLLANRRLSCSFKKTVQCHTIFFQEVFL